MTDSIKALTFDVFGTVVDWRSSLIEEGERLSKRLGYKVSWEEFADKWRAGYGPAMQRVRQGDIAWTNIDNLHRTILDELIIEFGLTSMTEKEVSNIFQQWLRLSNHIQHVEIPQYTNPNNFQLNLDARIKYMRNQISESKFKSLISLSLIHI